MLSEGCEGQRRVREWVDTHIIDMERVGGLTYFVLQDKKMVKGWEIDPGTEMKMKRSRHHHLP